MDIKRAEKIVGRESEPKRALNSSTSDVYDIVQSIKRFDVYAYGFFFG